MIKTSRLRLESMYLPLLSLGLAWLALSCGGSSSANQGSGGSVGSSGAGGGVAIDGSGGAGGGGTGGGGTGGSGGTGGAAPADGGGVDGPSCFTGTIGPLDTWDTTTRPPFGWTFVGPLASGAADGGATDGGPPADASGPARCVIVPSASRGLDGVRCQGIAMLRMRTTGPEITFADGSALVWDGTVSEIFAPFVTAPTGDSVWVDFERRTAVVCPVCGSYTTRTLQVRDGEAGQVRLFTQNGVVLPAISDAQARDIFGVTAQTVPTCSFRATAGCYRFVRTHNDHILNTTPPLRIYNAEWSSVVPAPKGNYRVFWASSTESDKQFMSNCADGPAVATDNGFTAVLSVR